MTSINPYAAPTANLGDGPQAAKLGEGPSTKIRYLVVLVTTLSSFMLYLDRVCIAQTERFIKVDLSLSDNQIAWVLSAFFWSYALCQVPSGWFSDRFGARVMMTVYIVAWSMFTIFTGLAFGFWMLLTLRLLFGAAQAGAYPTSGGLLSKWVPFSARSMASSLVAFGGRAGGAVALLVTAVLADRVGWRPVMIGYGVIGILVAVYFWFCYRNRPQEHPACNQAERDLIESGRPPGSASPHAHSPIGPMFLRLISSPSMWLMCISQWGTNIGWAFLITWLPRYLKTVKNLSEAQTGTLSFLIIVAGMIGMLGGGAVADWSTRRLGLRWGRALPLALSRFVAAGAYLACLYLDSPWAAVLAFAVVAAATDLGVGATWAYMQDVGGRHVGSILGWGNMWGNFGAALSPLLLRAAVEKWDTNGDWHEAFVVCSLAFFVSGIASLGINATIPIAVPEKPA